MLRIAVIGAGSLTFTRKIMMDVLAVPEFRNAEFRFMDIDEDRLAKVAEVCRHMIKESKQPAAIKATTDRRRALEGVDYVICVARVGGLKAFEKDVLIPLKYGVDQCVGDTLCVGGIFYALRTIPVLLDICADMRKVCPQALLINHTNPMAMNSWAAYKHGGVRYVGLCHGVEAGAKLIAKAWKISHQEMQYICAGINHQTWYLQAKHNGKDLLPNLLKKMEADPDIRATEPVRLDILRRFGYFSTESNGHLSEYLPWYRKGKGWKHKWISHRRWIHGASAGYYRECMKRSHDFEESYSQFLDGTLPTITFGTRSGEHGSYIMEALETGRPYRGFFNVMNHGIISNLPDESCVEVPGLVDKHGIHPLHVGELPIQCAAICKHSIIVQEMAVQAALTGDKNLVRQAVSLDPLCGAILNTSQIWEMTDEMFKALAKWMPQFGK